MTDPADMTPEQLRMEIAEWCGWTIHKEANHKPEGWIDPYGNWKAIITSDYPNDLNAMAVELDRLNRAQRYEWTRNMRAVINEQATAEQLNPDTKLIEDFYFYNATALQRAIAFVRTVRG